jgi:MFS family permease
MSARPRTPAGVVGTSVVATVLVALPSCLLGALGLVMRTDLGFSAAELGFTVGTFFLASALTSLASGRLALAEFLGARPSIFVGIIVTVAVLVYVAGFATNWVQIAIALGVVGLANGLVQPGANLAIARHVPRERMGLALGVKQAALPVATLIAGLAVGFLVLLGDWRAAWWIGAALAGVFVVVAFVVAPRASLRFGAPRPADGGRRRLAGHRPSASLLRATLASILASIGANAMRVFFIESAVHRGEELATAGFLLAAASIVGIGTRLVGGWRSDRVPRDPYVSAAVLMIAGAVGYLLMAFVEGTPLLLLAAVLGISAGWGWSGLVQLGAVRAHPEAPGAVSSFVHFGGLFGNLLGPILFGLLLPAGLVLAWCVIAVVSAAGALLLFVDVRLGHRAASAS